MHTHGRRYPVKEPRHDDERLSELLDGRLEGPERDELLAYLATAGEDYEVVTEAAAILLEAELEAAREAEAGATDSPQRLDAVPPSTRARGRWLRPGARRLIAFTAVLAGLVVVGISLSRGRGGFAGDPVRLAMLVGGRGAPSAGWYERPLLVPDRGERDDEWTPAQAAEAGAYLMRLAVAIEAGDTAAIRRLADRIKQDFDPQGGSALDTITLRRGGPTSELNRLLEKQTKRLEERGSPDHLRIGASIEAAHLAAIQQDTAFFRRPDMRAVLRRAEGLSDGDPDAQRALAAVRAALPERGTPVWEDLPNLLEALLQALVT